MMSINNEPKWMDVTEKGEITKHEYFGRFLIRPFLTHAERSDATRLAERYCRGIESSEAQKLFLSTMAFLKFHVVESDADWWKGDGLLLYDQSPIYALAEQVAKVQGLDEKKDEKKDEKNV
jgi:hypothetical protein